MILNISKYLAFTALLISFANGQSLTSPIDNGKPAKQRQHTSIELLSSVKTIVPGTRFKVGILMKMDPGWHTYWKNSGEAGLPTIVKWELPDGFVAGNLEWPLPHKYNESGDVLTYGYADENMLLADITVPLDVIAGSSIRLRADVEWLECENICIPGSASADLDLQVSTDQPRANNVALFEQYESKVPDAFSDDTQFTLGTVTTRATLEVHLRPKDGLQFSVGNNILPDFYPEPIEELAIGRTTVSANPSEAILRIPLSVYEKSSKAFLFRGIVLCQMQGGEVAAATIEVPLSREFSSTLPVGGEATPPVSILDQTFSTVGMTGAGQPVYVYLLFAFIGGILLNVMPCVLPVIALKIFGLIQMVGDHPRLVKRLGWSFSLGIVVSFITLALIVIVLQAAGHQVGWGFQFQEPLFVIAMCVIVFGFGLSLFGVYEVGLPFVLAFAGVGSALEKKEHGHGYLESFTEGVFATILATPCTAPFLGAALGFAFSQPKGIILLIFTMVALGMALPYLIITAKPAWMKFLPKPGEWMVAVKQFMGFLMMATVVWLLYVLGKQLGMEAVVWVLAFLLTVGVSCWIIGRFATLVASRRTYVTTWIVAITIAVLGYWIFLESILDVRTVLAGSSSTSQNVITNDLNGIQWQPFSVDGLNEHLQANKIVFIDFTAEWCLTCKVNEKIVLADRLIVSQLKSPGIVAMRADWTKRNPEITKLLAKFGRSGVPLYVVFPAGRPEAPIVLPEVITTEIVNDALKKAAALQL